MSKTRIRGRTSAGMAAFMGMAIWAGIAGRSASAQIIVNGGFEDNGGAGFSNFTGWNTADQIGSAGSFYTQTGTGTPLFGVLIPAPPGGNFAAMSEGGGAGSHVLYQDFQAPVGVSSGFLSFQIFVNNQAADFFAPASLDFSAGSNQQARVDLLLAGSDPFSVAAGDVLLTLFQTNPGDPLTSGYTTITTDITSVLAAQSGSLLRLRFSEVDSIAPLNLGVDDVSLVVPEPSTLALLFAGGTVGSSLFLRRRRARK